jgi:hypothetical protein
MSKGVLIMMEDLIQTVCEKTGITPEQARTAVETVFAHVRTILPEPIAAQVEQCLCHAAPAGSAPPLEGSAEEKTGLSDLMRRVFG